MKQGRDQSHLPTARLSRIVHWIGLLLFCVFPFTEISCLNNEEQVTGHAYQSGLQAAVGSYTVFDDDLGLKLLPYSPAFRPLMIVCGLALLTGLFLFLFKRHHRKWTKAEACCGFIAFACLVIQYFVLPDYRSELGYQKGETSGASVQWYTMWLYIMIIFTVISSVLALQRLRALNQDDSPQGVE